MRPGTPLAHLDGEPKLLFILQRKTKTLDPVKEAESSQFPAGQSMAKPDLNDK